MISETGDLLEFPEGVAEMLQRGDAALGKDSPSMKVENIIMLGAKHISCA